MSAVLLAHWRPLLQTSNFRSGWEKCYRCMGRYCPEAHVSGEHLCFLSACVVCFLCCIHFAGLPSCILLSQVLQMLHMYVLLLCAALA